MWSDIASSINALVPGAGEPLLPRVEGRLTRVVGMTLEAEGVDVSIGQACDILTNSGPVAAEVVGFSDQKVFLMPMAQASNLRVGTRVRPRARADGILVGNGLLGRVIDALGQPLDRKGPLSDVADSVLGQQAINPLDRHPISEPLDVGIRAINGLLTVGKGQRIGLFAGSGVGKSVLMGMMTRFTQADVVVVGLIGERGREVKEFVDHILGKEGLARAVVVASPADDAPLQRLRASHLATEIAEYFRDQGKNVLLLMDSLTRYAQAQREIALAIGEPPATRGYPPSVFARLPQLVERAGNGVEGGGSITAFYTVLTEGDDLQDPIADSARAILDGHIVLSRRLADEGLYPAIDVEASISRVMPNVVSEQHLRAAQQFKGMMSQYTQNKDLISIGAYQPGSDKTLDLAIERLPYLKDFVRQSLNQPVSFRDAEQGLRKLLQPAPLKPSMDRASAQADSQSL
ncbi:flagellar protein export ATPase FliI [Simiduia curdlanivorans]|uniref:Flagellum-specific ATP synthase n=1 Tax=Simiduia curdlanivorans TaxID=1492769 RepID=A0ABV8V7C6_9GAMM|nr:flagellar protein export ATPase FliI [Simiduia curdlanivorans]MDN3639858.1 flagellar protein export ATPase FliI [Simiduia curdlanivorans]